MCLVNFQPLVRKQLKFPTSCLYSYHRRNHLFQLFLIFNTSIGSTRCPYQIGRVVGQPFSVSSIVLEQIQIHVIIFASRS